MRNCATLYIDFNENSYNHVFERFLSEKNSKLVIKVVVTSSSLAKQGSFREPNFVLTQPNYWKLQRTVKRKQNKRIIVMLNLQIPIHFLLSFLAYHENEILVL